MNYELTDDVQDSGQQWRFQTDFWNTYIVNENEDAQILKLPDINSEYLELQLYIRRNTTEEDEKNSEISYTEDEDVYIEEEGKVYDDTDKYDSEWEAVGESVKIDIK